MLAHFYCVLSVLVCFVSSTELLRRWWPFATRSSTFQRPLKTWWLGLVTCGFVGLARHRAFSKAAEVINSCHVRIKPPCSPDGHCCKNRKLFSSIILQAVLCSTSSMQTAGTRASNIHSPSSLPISGWCRVWQPSASMAIIPGHVLSLSVPLE